MTPLPPLPPNLAPTIPQIPSYTNELQSVTQALSVGAKIKEEIVNTILPLNNPPLSGSLSGSLIGTTISGSLGTIPIPELTDEEIEKKVLEYLKTIVIVNIPAIPPEVKLLLGIVEVTKELPSYSEIKRIINKRREERRKRKQQQLINKQKAMAEAAELPFTQNK